MSRNYKPACPPTGSIIRKVFIVKEYQFWRHDNKPIELYSNKVIWEKISYGHNNPVEAGLVYREQDHDYSSAADYEDVKELLEGIVVF